MQIGQTIQNYIERAMRMELEYLNNRLSGYNTSVMTGFLTLKVFRICHFLYWFLLRNATSKMHRISRIRTQIATAMIT